MEHRPEEWKLKGKRVTVLGLGREGAAVARFLVQQGAAVTVTDLKGAEELRPVLEDLASLPLHYELGGHPQRVLDDPAHSFELPPGFLGRDKVRRKTELLGREDLGINDQVILLFKSSASLSKTKNVARSDVCRAKCIDTTLLGLDAIGPLNALIPAH